MKIQNTFLEAIVQNDLDERLTNGALIGEPKNIAIFTNDVDSDAGILKNVTGNVKKTNYGFPQGETIGSGKNESGEKIYELIKGSAFDYLMEYDATTNTSTRVLQSSTGGVLNFISGERITQFDFFVDVETGNILIFWSGDSNPPRVVNVETAKTWDIDDFTNDEISLMKPSPIFAPLINLTTSVDGVENNFIEDKFLCFATRYKYSDGFYSAPSSWTKPAFTPREFNLDYQTFENLGMLNLSNAVDVTFNTGPRDVVQVDLLFRESNTTNIYVVEQFVKSDEGWGNNSNQVFQFSKAKIYTVLPEDQFFRNFDNVPLSARCQTAIGNRIAYANFIEGRNISEKIDFDVELVTENPFSEEIEGDIQEFISASNYSNIIDWAEGVPNGGPSPVDQMNYETNTVEMNLAAVPGVNTGIFIISVTPKTFTTGILYDIIVKEGATTVNSFLGLSGNQTRNFNYNTNKDLTFYVVSEQGLLYTSELTYEIRSGGTVLRSSYKYSFDLQLSLPKSGGYGSTLVGDTIIESVASFDMSSYEFKAGNQIRINLDLQSSLVETFRPSVTFFYNISNDYTDLTDFLTNPTSGFISQLEVVFTETFRNNFISNEGTFVSIIGFKVTQSGNNLLVQMPIVVYNVTEPGPITVQKTEFYLITEANLQTVNQNAFTSLHSNRDYEVGLIYMDEQGRKTTILNTQNNTIYIPADNSELSNKLRVTINNNPPSWAKYYKFAIKQVKRDYDIIYGNIVYEDGIFRWIKLEGENKGKIKDGDLLTVKSDYGGPLQTVQKARVLEVVSQDANFISGNLLANGNELLEQSGLYFKIKQGNFDINIGQSAFKSYIGSGKRRYASRSFVATQPLFGFYEPITNNWVPDELKAGAQIRFAIVIKAFGSIAFNHTLNIFKTVQQDYASVYDWFTDEIATDSAFTDYANNYLSAWDFGDGITQLDNSLFRVKPWRDGTASRDIMTDVVFDVNFSGGTLIFETEPIEQLNSVFFETPETYIINNGNHEFANHLLNDAYNCFSFGNGVESYKIRDTLTGKPFSIDSNPTDINKEGYKQLNRFADITYSEIFNSNTNVNRLNEFNLSLGNFKDDVEKSWGPINVMKGFDTNLDVIQEDKYSIVYYGKDLLFNADGSTNLTGVPQVLGQQKSLDGEFGCQNTESFDFYGFNRYFVDVKRGSVIRRSNNGLFEISNQGMRAYFRRLFRNNTINNIIAQYDQFNDVLILNIKYNGTEYLTWLYSDKNNGWLGTQTFNPEDMIRMNGSFYSFKNGEIYLHNQEFDGTTPNYNKFYGEEFESEASFNFSQMPSEGKVFKAIKIEGTVPPNMVFETDLDKGYINSEDFKLQEGDYFAYIRCSNDVVDTSLLAYQGIGNCTISGLALNFDVDVDPIISVGDLVLNSNLQIVGTILSKTANSLTLNTVNNLSTGEFVLASKPKSVQVQGILGYYSKVTMTFSSNVRQEIFAVSAEIAKSYD
jgi:hypothetical protein